MKSRQGPAFIGIGAPHTGLGGIATWLSEHESVVDHIPACNFFNTDLYEKRGLDWYEARLRSTARRPGQLMGDISPGYLAAPEAATRIVDAYPDAKLFVVVRHPLRRAIAAYLANREIDTTIARMNAAEYLTHYQAEQRQSSYALHLEQYFAFYSPVTLKVIIYEELANSPLTVMQDLYAYIDINKDAIPKGLKHFAPPPDPPKNPGLIKRSIMKGKAVYKKLTERPIGPVFPVDPDLDAYLSPEEKALFLKAFVAPTTQLSHLMGRDMVAYWDLVPE